MIRSILRRSKTPDRRTGPTRQRLWRERIVGACLLVLALLLALGMAGHLVPDENQFFGTICRMADSMRPHLLALAIFVAATLFALGDRALALAGATLAILGLASIAAGYSARSAPTGTRADLTVLWFNILGQNDISADTLETALRATDADILAFGEAAPAFPMRARLADRYPHAIGCDAPHPCEMLILSRYPLHDVNRARLSRGAVNLVSFTVTPPGLPRTNVISAHLVKPWYLSTSAEELGRLSRAIGTAGPGPRVVMGDFNAAPWSRRMRGLARYHELGHAPWPRATWPVAAGPVGIPIDHVLLGGGAAFSAHRAWGADLGSNHLGLLARIDLGSARGEEAARR